MLSLLILSATTYSLYRILSALANERDRNQIYTGCGRRRR